MEPLITDTIFEQIMELRRSGKYNMFDKPGIQREAYEKGYFELVCLLEEHVTEYNRFILTGER